MTACILTTDAALFPGFGNDRHPAIRTLGAKMEQGGVLSLTESDFLQSFRLLEREFSAILVLLAADEFAGKGQVAFAAAQHHGGIAKISLVETQQIGIGLGLLSQLAAQKALTGTSLSELEAFTRAAIPNLFTLICPESDFTLDGRQKTPVGSSTLTPGSLEVYSLEAGQFLPYKRVRIRRHLLDIFREFIEEFETPQQVACFCGTQAGLRLKPLRDLTNSLFPETIFTETRLNPLLTRLFGAQTIGITVLDLPL